ncbi:receptor-like protein kinase [Seminavis robusta]|uniref:Receptor-like protein kinase n=1 Tax=Seminavis robusta TaxID=568900 RepID=A0A9N8ELG2_9STRA|nr:receptor-like protein kinase [Seminavis robusta]|eukprot:Sro1195_g251390.1 receptor-like protein kinase (637) ;mRNA; r:12857-15054
MDSSDKEIQAKGRSQSDEDTCKESPSDDDDVVPRVHNDDTLLSAASEGDDAEAGTGTTQEPTETDARGKVTCLAGYSVMYGAIFVLIATVLILPLVISKEGSENKAPSSTLPLASARPTGGLSLPAPHNEVSSSNAPLTVQASPTPPTNPEGWTKSPTASPTATNTPTTDAPTFSAPTTLAQATVPPIKEGESRLPSSSPSLNPSTRPEPTETPSAPPQPPVPVTVSASAKITPKPTEATPIPSFMPTATPTKKPASSRPSSYPSLEPVDLFSTPLFNYLVVLGTPEELLSDPSTAQGRAFLWLMQPEVEQISVFRVPQRYALVALDFALHDDDDDDDDDQKSDEPNSRVANGEQAAPRRWRTYDKDMCDWEGVTCDSRKEVVAIKWSGQGLRGKLINEISMLQKLQTVDLAQNHITGKIDPFWDLPHLKELFLFENRFSGTVPERPAPEKLDRVYLGKNRLEGGFPLAFTTATGGGPKDLRYLILHHNRFNGTLPERLRLRSLYYLDISDNAFEGSIAGIDWPQMLPALRIMYLENNKFSGELPQDFPQVGGGNVKQLFLQGNNFTGSFPSWGWSDYHLTNMNIAHNNFDEIRDLCGLGVFESGELVELRADCNVCTCDTLCHTCVNKTEEGKPV